MPTLCWRRRGSKWLRHLVAAAAVVPEEAEEMVEERSWERRLLPFHYRLQRLLIL